MEQGYTVQTPFGLFYASASGTTNDLQDDFRPLDDSTNHTIRFLYRPSTAIIASVRENTRFERAGNGPKTVPYSALIKNAGENEAAPVRPGDTIMIAGDYLKFDRSDNNQGIFLVNSADTYRLSYYTHNTEKEIEARIEQTIPTGTYTVVLKNTPNTKLVKTTYRNQVILS